jgi:hypothetical protein
MGSDRILDHLREVLRRIMNEHADSLATGNCQDYAEYKRFCGIIEGLALAEREILDIKEKVENS